MGFREVVEAATGGCVACLVAMTINDLHVD